MDLSMTNSRILKSQSIYHDRFPEIEDELDENFYLKQIFNLNLQVESLKQTCIMYQKDIDDLKLKSKKSNEAHLKNDKNLKSEIEKLLGELKQKDIEFDKKISYFQQE